MGGLDSIEPPLWNLGNFPPYCVVLVMVITAQYCFFLTDFDDENSICDNGLKIRNEKLVDDMKKNNFSVNDFLNDE